MRTDEDQPEYTLEADAEMADERQGDVLTGVVGGLFGELQATIREDRSQYKVLQLLSDNRWHCRSCEGKTVASDQYAGGGGIQGLQRGNSKRDGLVIERRKHYCETCAKKTTWDRWTGETQKANAAANIPPKLVERVLQVYGNRDAIENRRRERHELVIDHRFPMERWGQSERPHDIAMTDEQIRRKFQLLKKDEGGNHNLLKSRACERCITQKKRGAPLGINFWYIAGENWPVEAERGPEAEAGCYGCGWYDFQAWREALNRHLADITERESIAGHPPLAE